jgi:hypothetical protein
MTTGKELTALLEAPYNGGKQLRVILEEAILLPRASNVQKESASSKEKQEEEHRERPGTKQFLANLSKAHFYPCTHGRRD